MEPTYENLMAKARELHAQGDMEKARRLAQIALHTHQAAPPKPDNPIGQFGHGIAQGGAELAGMPVDFMTGAINAMQPPNVSMKTEAGPDGVPRPKVTGTENAPLIENPVGGSEWMKSTFMKGVPEPQTGRERFARRAGEEVGFGAPIGFGAGATARGVRAIPKVMGMNAGMDAAAAASGQAAGEVAENLGAGPDVSNATDSIVSMLMGMGSAKGLEKATKTKPPAPTMQENFTAGRDALDRARNSGVALTPQSFDQYKMSLDDVLQQNRATDPRLNPRAVATVEGVQDAPSRDFGEIMDDRKVFGKKVAANAEEADAGVALKKRTEEFLDSLTNADVTGGDPSSAVADMKEGNKLIHQAHKAKEITGQEVRADKRAAVAGRGGNSTNTMRQNVGKIWEKEIAPTKPGQRHGYTPDEVEQMRKIVFGEGAQNAMRHVAGFSPTTGALQAVQSLGLAGGGAAAGLATGNPMYYLGMIPPAAGLIAKGLSEKSTKKQIAELLDIVNRGGEKALAKAPDSVKRAIAAQLLSRGGQAVQQ